jgi:hypothetical protein
MQGNFEEFKFTIFTVLQLDPSLEIISDPASRPDPARSPDQMTNLKTRPSKKDDLKGIPAHQGLFGDFL